MTGWYFVIESEKILHLEETQMIGKPVFLMLCTCPLPMQISYIYQLPESVMTAAQISLFVHLIGLQEMQVEHKRPKLLVLTPEAWHMCFSMEIRQPARCPN